MDMIECVGCGGRFPDIEGPVHRYMASCPGCWAAFGEVLAREYGDPAFYAVHRLSVDTYAVQHPGRPTSQCVHSVGLHLIRLCLFIERGLSAERANAAMLEAGKHKDRFVWLEPPAALGELTVADVVDARMPEAHVRAVNAWARSAWSAWAPHHDAVRAWLPA